MFLKNIYYNFKHYQFLLYELIKRDFKVKYKRSVLGVMWSILYPLLMMSVMALVFSNIFRFQMEGVNFLVYLMTGLVVFQFFSEATSGSLTAIIGNFSLINKVYIPKYIFPLAKCLFATLNFALTLIPLFLIILVTGSYETGTNCYLNVYYLLLPFIMFCLLMFVIGVSYFLSTMTVFLRDVLYIWGIVLTIFQYFTPIFYPIGMLPDWLGNIIRFNPLYVYISSMREIFLFSRPPTNMTLLLGFLFGLTTMIIGMYIFRKKQDKFVYYI